MTKATNTQSQYKYVMLIAFPPQRWFHERASMLCYVLLPCSLSVLPLGKKTRLLSYVYWTVHHGDSWIEKDQLDVTCYFFHFLCAQHVLDINISIIRSLRLFCWITTVVVLFLAEACNTDTTPTQPHRNSNTHRTKKNTTNVVIQQNSRKLLIMDILMSETCWAHKKWNKIASDISWSFTLQDFSHFSKPE